MSVRIIVMRKFSLFLLSLVTLLVVLGISLPAFAATDKVTLQIEGMT